MDSAVVLSRFPSFPRMLIFSSLKWVFCLLTPHESCLVSFQRPPVCTNRSSLINSEPPCLCNCVFCSFGPSSSQVSRRSQLIQADRISSPLDDCAAHKFVCLCQSKYLLCSEQRKPRVSGQRNPAAEFHGSSRSPCFCHAPPRDVC